MKNLLFTVVVIFALVVTGCSEYEYNREYFESSTSFSTAHITFESNVTTRANLVNGRSIINLNSFGVISDEMFGKDEPVDFVLVDGTELYEGEEVSGSMFYAFWPNEGSLYWDSAEAETYISGAGTGNWHYNSERQGRLQFIYSGEVINSKPDGDYSLTFGDANYYDYYNKIQQLPMIAKSIDNNFCFKQTMGMFSFSLSGHMQVYEVTLYSNNGEPLGGTGYVDIDSDNPIFEIDDNSSDASSILYINRKEYDLFHTDLEGNHWISLPIAILGDEPQTFYIPVPAQHYSKGISLKLEGYNDNGDPVTMFKTTEMPVSVSRGVIKEFSSLNVDDYILVDSDNSDIERQVLMDLYEATDGAHWTNNMNWGSDLPLNEWYGVYINNNDIVALDLPSNNLNGYLPESIGNLTELTYLSLYDNGLTGDIPSSIGNLSKLEYLYLFDNNLTGTIPDSFVNLINIEAILITGNRMNGVISEDLLNSDWWKKVNLRLTQQDGYRLTYGYLYESSDFSKDGEVVKVYQHSIGKGIKMVVLGDCFSDRLIADGTYMNYVNQSINAFFEVEPYASFKDYFDIYVVYAVSKNEDKGYDVAFSTRIESGHYEYDLEKVVDYVLKVPDLNESASNVTTIFIVNEQEDGRYYTQFFNDGFSIAMCGTPLIEIIQHEGGGHGFGKLADEYEEEGIERDDDLSIYHQIGWYLNVDSTDNPDEVLWKDFIVNPDYQVEGIGIFEGANYASKGVYRATETSIMRTNWGDFNAPSRWAIYQKIMDIGGVNYTFDDFLQYDKKNLQRITTTRAYDGKNVHQIDWRKHSAPPRINNYSSREIKVNH